MKIRNSETPRKQDGKGMKGTWKARDYQNNWLKLPFKNRGACCSKAKKTTNTQKPKKTWFMYAYVLGSSPKTESLFHKVAL